MLSTARARSMVRKLLAKAVAAVARLQMATLTATIFFRFPRSAQMPNGRAPRVLMMRNAVPSVPISARPKPNSLPMMLAAPAKTLRSSMLRKLIANRTQKTYRAERLERLATPSLVLARGAILLIVHLFFIVESFLNAE